MPATEPGLRFSVGVSESGKTTGIRRDVLVASKSFPVVVVDRVKDKGWSELPIPGARGATTMEHARHWMKNGVRIVIIRPKREAMNEETLRACEWALEHPRRCGLALPEVQHIAPTGPPSALPDVLMELVTAWRHYDVAAWFDTQRFALSNATLAAQAREVRLYTMHADVDLARVKSLVRGGDELIAAIDECANRFDRKEYGWHVTLSASRRPPFVIER